MEEVKARLQDITEIKQILQNSTKFMSLSGLSGIIAGLAALGGAAGAYYYLESIGLWGVGQQHFQHLAPGALFDSVTFSLLGIALAVIGVTILAALYFSSKMAEKKGLPFWNQTAKRMLVSLSIPLLAGGFYCAVQLYHGNYEWLASNMLIFYGLALLNASKYTLNEIRYLGLLEIMLGLASAVWWGNGIWFWAAGFGVLHIAYGAWMFYKYER
jgi:hypothetical protein